MPTFSLPKPILPAARTVLRFPILTPALVVVKLKVILAGPLPDRVGLVVNGSATPDKGGPS